MYCRVVLRSGMVQSSIVQWYSGKIPAENRDCEEELPGDYQLQVMPLCSAVMYCTTEHYFASQY